MVGLCVLTLLSDLQVTALTLEKLPGCSLSTLSQCSGLQFLSLRCCGLTSLEGLSQLPQLCYVDAQVSVQLNHHSCSERLSTLR